MSLLDPIIPIGVGRRIPRGIKWTVALLVLVLMTGIMLRRCSGPGAHQATPPDTASAASWRARTDSLEHQYAAAAGELGGIKGKLATAAARIRGLEARALEVRTVFDTIIRPDTVLLSVAVDRGGRVTGAVGIRADSSSYRPGVSAPADITSCDDGWHLEGLRLLCDRARLGHLSLVVRAGAAGRAPPLPPDSITWVAAAGLRWTPSFRSTMAAEISIDRRRRVELMLERGVRLW